MANTVLTLFISYLSVVGVLTLVGIWRDIQNKAKCWWASIALSLVAAAAWPLILIHTYASVEVD